MVIMGSRKYEPVKRQSNKSREVALGWMERIEVRKSPL